VRWWEQGWLTDEVASLSVLLDDDQCDHHVSSMLVCRTLPRRLLSTTMSCDFSASYSAESPECSLFSLPYPTVMPFLAARRKERIKRRSDNESASSIKWHLSLNFDTIADISLLLTRFVREKSFLQKFCEPDNYCMCVLLAGNASRQCDDKLVICNQSIVCLFVCLSVCLSFFYFLFVLLFVPK